MTMVVMTGRFMDTSDIFMLTIEVLQSVI
jgi:hypothetical protein